MVSTTSFIDTGVGGEQLEYGVLAGEIAQDNMQRAYDEDAGVPMPGPDRKGASATERFGDIGQQEVKRQRTETESEDDSEGDSSEGERNIFDDASVNENYDSSFIPAVVADLGLVYDSIETIQANANIPNLLQIAIDVVTEKEDIADFYYKKDGAIERFFAGWINYNEETTGDLSKCLWHMYTVEGKGLLENAFLQVVQALKKDDFKTQDLDLLTMHTFEPTEAKELKPEGPVFEALKKKINDLGVQFPENPWKEVDDDVWKNAAVFSLKETMYTLFSHLIDAISVEKNLLEPVRKEFLPNGVAPTKKDELPENLQQIAGNPNSFLSYYFALINNSDEDGKDDGGGIVDVGGDDGGGIVDVDDAHFDGEVYWRQHEPSQNPYTLTRPEENPQWGLAKGFRRHAKENWDTFPAQYFNQQFMDDAWVLYNEEISFAQYLKDKERQAKNIDVVYGEWSEQNTLKHDAETALRKEKSKDFIKATRSRKRGRKLYLQWEKEREDELRDEGRRTFMLTFVQQIMNAHLIVQEELELRAILVRRPLAPLKSDKDVFLGKGEGWVHAGPWSDDEVFNYGVKRKKNDQPSMITNFRHAFIAKNEATLSDTYETLAERNNVCFVKLPEKHWSYSEKPTQITTNAYTILQKGLQQHKLAYQDVEPHNLVWGRMDFLLDPKGKEEELKKEFVKHYNQELKWSTELPLRPNVSEETILKKLETKRKSVKFFDDWKFEQRFRKPFWEYGEKAGRLHGYGAATFGGDTSKYVGILRMLRALELNQEDLFARARPQILKLFFGVSFFNQKLGLTNLSIAKETIQTMIEELEKAENATDIMNVINKNISGKTVGDICGFRLLTATDGESEEVKKIDLPPGTPIPVQTQNSSIYKIVQELMENQYNIQFLEGSENVDDQNFDRSILNQYHVPNIKRKHAIDMPAFVLACLKVHNEKWGNESFKEKLKAILEGEKTQLEEKYVFDDSDKFIVLNNEEETPIEFASRLFRAGETEFDDEEVEVSNHGHITSMPFADLGKKVLQIKAQSQWKARKWAHINWYKAFELDEYDKYMQNLKEAAGSL